MSRFTGKVALVTGSTPGLGLGIADRLIREAKVATIPLSPFYAAAPPMTLLRLCTAKRDETLAAAAERLRSFAARI